MGGNGHFLSNLIAFLPLDTSKQRLSIPAVTELEGVPILLMKNCYNVKVLLDRVIL